MRRGRHLGSLGTAVRAETGDSELLRALSSSPTVRSVCAAPSAHFA
jgi:hypothetical protein